MSQGLAVLLHDLLGKPLIIHEQNAVAGFTNKQLAHISNASITGISCRHFCTQP
jgi:UDP-N-acetylglucosamine:LPS N-acetylglucosamine transferase